MKEAKFPNVLYVRREDVLKVKYTADEVIEVVAKGKDRDEYFYLADPQITALRDEDETEVGVYHLAEIKKIKVTVDLE